MSDSRRRIPGTDTLLGDPRIAGAALTLGRDVVKRAIGTAQQRARRGEIDPDNVREAAVAELPDQVCSLHEVLNATGIVVHTNLGRAPLSEAAVEAIRKAAGYTDVEFDLGSGQRARRGRGAAEALAAAVPGAGEVHVVNNNAAALLLCALVFAQGKEIVISKGELVEIGAGFRIPDLLTGAGARLREVGTTNRTTVADYADAISQDTAFVLTVHPSNFRISGFTATPEVAELSGLGVPVISDIGSGLLQPHRRLPGEPDATSMLRSGADLVTASADKLLGGPQAGLILGQSHLVTRLRSHPAARAMRVDKLTLAALEASLRGPDTPVSEAIEAGQPELRKRADALASSLRKSGVDSTATDTDSAVGGGGAPGVSLPSAALLLPETYASPLRNGSPPVIGRVENGMCVLDLRTVPSRQDARLAAAIRAVSECR